MLKLIGIFGLVSFLLSYATELTYLSLLFYHCLTDQLVINCPQSYMLLCLQPIYYQHLLCIAYMYADIFHMYYTYCISRHVNTKFSSISSNGDSLMLIGCDSLLHLRDFVSFVLA